MDFWQGSQIALSLSSTIKSERAIAILHMRITAASIPTFAIHNEF